MLSKGSSERYSGSEGGLDLYKNSPIICGGTLTCIPIGPSMFFHQEGGGPHTSHQSASSLSAGPRERREVRVSQGLSGAEWDVECQQPTRNSPTRGVL
jgi:hypothetical protein